MIERFRQLRIEELDADTVPLAKEILKVSSAGLGGPYNVLLRSPEMAKRAFHLFDYLRFNTSVPRHLNEFAILIQARLANAQYEWWAHYPIALKCGLRATLADTLREGSRPRDMDEDERAVFDYCVRLSLDTRVSDASFARIKARLSEQQVVDLTVLSGTYVMVSMLLNAAQVGIPDGGPEPLRMMTHAELRAGLLRDEDE
jgi:4-carboxymuconolactone decarboxylase